MQSSINPDDPLKPTTTNNQPIFKDPVTAANDAPLPTNKETAKSNRRRFFANTRSRLRNGLSATRDALVKLLKYIRSGVESLIDLPRRAAAKISTMVAPQRSNEAQGTTRPNFVTRLWSKMPSVGLGGVFSRIRNFFTLSTDANDVIHRPRGLSASNVPEPPQSEIRPAGTSIDIENPLATPEINSGFNVGRRLAPASSVEGSPPVQSNITFGGSQNPIFENPFENSQFDSASSSSDHFSSEAQALGTADRSFEPPKISAPAGSRVELTMQPEAPTTGIKLVAPSEEESVRELSVPTGKKVELQMGHESVPTTVAVGEQEIGATSTSTVSLTTPETTTHVKIIPVGENVTETQEVIAPPGSKIDVSVGHEATTASIKAASGEEHKIANLPTAHVHKVVLRYEPETVNLSTQSDKPIANISSTAEDIIGSGLGNLSRPDNIPLPQSATSGSQTPIIRQLTPAPEVPGIQVSPLRRLTPQPNISVESIGSQSSQDSKRKVGGSPLRFAKDVIHKMTSPKTPSARQDAPPQLPRPAPNSGL